MNESTNPIEQGELANKEGEKGEEIKETTKKITERTKGMTETTKKKGNDDVHPHRQRAFERVHTSNRTRNKQGNSNMWYVVPSGFFIPKRRSEKAIPLIHDTYSRIKSTIRRVVGHALGRWDSNPEKKPHTHHQDKFQSSSPPRAENRRIGKPNICTKGEEGRQAQANGTRNEISRRKSSILRDVKPHAEFLGG